MTSLELAQKIIRCTCGPSWSEEISRGVHAANCPIRDRIDFEVADLVDREKATLQAKLTKLEKAVRTVLKMEPRPSRRGTKSSPLYSSHDFEAMRRTLSIALPTIDLALYRS